MFLSAKQIGFHFFGFHQKKKFLEPNFFPPKISIKNLLLKKNWGIYFASSLSTLSEANLFSWYLETFLREKNGCCCLKIDVLA